MNEKKRFEKEIGRFVQILFFRYYFSFLLTLAKHAPQHKFRTVRMEVTLIVHRYVFAFFCAASVSTQAISPIYTTHKQAAVPPLIPNIRHIYCIYLFFEYIQYYTCVIGFRNFFRSSTATVFVYVDFFLLCFLRL